MIKYEVIVAGTTIAKCDTREDAEKYALENYGYAD